MRLRRTMLYVPGNQPGMLKDAMIYGADSIMMDLEDSVAVHEKDAARLLVYHILKEMDFGGAEVVVRINTLESGLGQADIEAMVAAGVNVIRLPKTETAEDVKSAEIHIEKVERKLNIEVGKTKMMAAIEGPLGVINAYEIARASSRLIGIALGAEDFVTAMKTKRSLSGIELMTARSQIIMAARAAGIQAIDTVFSDVDDMEGFRQEVELIKQLGFDGKSIINPRQIQIVHEVYTPTKRDIEKSLSVLEALKEAEAKGSGVAALNGKMIDKPIVDRAKGVISLAKACGIYQGEESA